MLFDHNNTFFPMGILFPTIDMLKNVVMHYYIMNMFKMTYVKSEVRHITTVCHVCDCLLRLHSYLKSSMQMFDVRKFTDIHTCAHVIPPSTNISSSKCLCFFHQCCNYIFHFLIHYCPNYQVLFVSISWIR